MEPVGGDLGKILVHFGPDPTTPELHIAMGYKEHDYVVNIYIEIEDIYGQITTTEVTTQVCDTYSYLYILFVPIIILILACP